MIVIQTYKYNRITGECVHKEYKAAPSVADAMRRLNHDRLYNDLTIYDPIVIVNVFDTEE
jgi:hypothetical protein